MKIRYFIFCFISLLVMNCKTEKEEIDRNNFSMLHISHTRANVPDSIMPSLQQIDYSAYDLLCLGGDLDYTTSASDRIMNRWDQLFNFGNPATLWSLGNHDATDRNLIQQYTGRPSYYSWSNEFITVVVLDTQLDSSRISGDQLALFNAVVDTLSTTKNLLLLTHKLLWIPDHPELNASIDSVPNGGAGRCNYCTQPNNFYQAIYPKLVELRRKGISVICLAGDIGKKVSEFEYLTRDSIYFLASGIEVFPATQKVLVFNIAESTDGILEWEYRSVENLLQK